MNAFLKLATALVAGFVALGSAAVAQDELPTITIGYLDLDEDIRYVDWGVHPVDIRSSTAIGDRRAYAGAQLGLEELGRLQVYLWTYIALVLMLTLWVVPAMITSLTSLTYRQVVGHTGSIVGDFNHDIAAAVELATEFDLALFDIGRCLPCVAQQIEQHRFQQVPVRIDVQFRRLYA